MNPILQSNPGASYFAHKAAIDAAALHCLESRWYILGAQVRAFETEFSQWLSAQSDAPIESQTIGVASGTDALQVAMRALGIGSGDVVFVPSHTAVATATAVDLVGATPYFVDIDPRCYTLSPSDLEAAIAQARKENAGHLKAIIAVHLYGQAANLEAIQTIARANDLFLIEDCAQAHGATRGGKTAGLWGDVAAFSFYPTKNLGALGDGGAVVSTDENVIEQARLMREYGWKERYVSHERGMNSRLDELQAAILRVKLEHLTKANARRAQIAALYDELLPESGLTLPRTHCGNGHVWHQYVIRVPEKRDDLQAFLKEHGIGTIVHYPVPIHRQPAYADFTTRPLPQTESAARQVLSLPMYPELSDDEVQQVAKTVLEGLHS